MWDPFILAPSRGLTSLAHRLGSDTIVTAHARIKVLSALGIFALMGLSPKGASMVEVPPTAYKAWLVLFNSRCGIPSSFPPLGA